MTPSGGGKPPAGLRDLDDIDAVFGALAHATRRHVLQVLAARHGTMTAGELSGRFSHSWPTTTRHLAVLVDAGLVSVASVGRERHYRLERQRLGDVLALWVRSVGFELHAHDPEPPAPRGGPPRLRPGAGPAGPGSGRGA